MKKLLNMIHDKQLVKFVSDRIHKDTNLLNYWKDNSTEHTFRYKNILYNIEYDDYEKNFIISRKYNNIEKINQVYER